MSSTSYGGNPLVVGSLYGLTGYNSGSGGVVLYMTTTQGGSGRSRNPRTDRYFRLRSCDPGSATFNVWRTSNNPSSIFPTANTVFKGIQFVPSQAPIVTTRHGLSLVYRRSGGDRRRSELDLERSRRRHQRYFRCYGANHRRIRAGSRSLSFTAPGGSGITGSFSPATGILTLAGVSSIANYQAALQSVTYADSSQNPSTATRTISFTATDVSLVQSSAATRSVNVIAVNNAPTVTVPGLKPSVPTLV